MPIIAPIPRTERRLMQKTLHKTRDKNHARRLTGLLMLNRGPASARLPERSVAPVHPWVAG